MHPDELRQVFDAEVGERHDLVVTYAVNPDDAISVSIPLATSQSQSSSSPRSFATRAMVKTA